MNVILLSGGSGKRLWPLSNEIRSKQFIKIFRKPQGEAGLKLSGGDEAAEEKYESMVQRVYRQIRAADPGADVTIATSKPQVSAIHNQLGSDVGISVEPCRRDTFPAIALAAAYLRDVKGVREEETVVVCPVDPYVEDDYFTALRELDELAAKGEAKLMLMGIDPTYPSEKYGYVMPASRERISKVEAFKEKPDAINAKKYIEQGGLWNAGVFAFRLGYVLDKAREQLGFANYRELFERYENCPKISFDYAVAEHEKEIAVMRFAGEWKDLGTWNTLTEAMEETAIGNVRMNDKCENVHVINELDVPILVMGGQNLVVSASPEGILVSDKEQSSYIKPFVDDLDQQVMFAEKSWGSYRVLDVKEESVTILVTLHPGHQMNYHSHERRDEVWTVISGTGKAILDGKERSVSCGDVLKMPAGMKHTIIADAKLQLIEVQLGKDISVADKIKHEL